MGEEGPLTKELFPPKEDFGLYLLMGQSNMAGRDLAGLDEQKVDSRILAFDYDGNWRVAKDPIHRKTGRTLPGVGPGISFAKGMLDDASNSFVGLVPCAVGGSPLGRWVKGGDLYQEALARAKEASMYGTLKGVIWHQGESDADDEAEAARYQARLMETISDLRQDLGMRDLPFVVGQLGGFISPEIAPFRTQVDQALRNVDLAVPHVGFANSSELVDKGDGLHFNAASARELGRRFAVAMQEEQGRIRDPELKGSFVEAEHVVSLWSEGAMPGDCSSDPEADLPWRGDHAQRITNVSHPTLSIYLADEKGRPAPSLIVSPGGGYSYTVYNKEGSEVAAWLNRNGINALVLKYRTPGNREGALQDLQRAIRLARQQAHEWNIDTERLGVIGFSAGGHLSARASLSAGVQSYESIDDVGLESAVPRFAILVYPAYLDNGSGSLADEFRDLKEAPPTLIVHSEDDQSYVGGSKLLYAEAEAKGIDLSLEMYSTGGHGYGLRSEGAAKDWPTAAIEWMKQRGILDAVAEGGDNQNRK